MRSWKPVAIYLILLCWFSVPGAMWARLRGPEGSEDIRHMEGNATYIFHAQVLSISAQNGRISIGGSIGNSANIAELKVDRWYKGSPQSETVRLKYFYAPIDGHDCIDLQRSSSWVIFARLASDGMYEFSDDCEGGLPMSPILAPKAKGTWMQRLQQDLIAGLQDNDPSFRLANIARLGALRTRSSGDALHEFVENGSDRESLWATYAALRSGDPRVFARVEDLVLEQWPREDEVRGQSDGEVWLASPGAAPNCGMDALKSHILFEIGRMRVPEAIPMLATIERRAKDHNLRSNAVSAIQFMRHPRALDALFDLLNDPDPNLKSAALTAITRITNAVQCYRNLEDDEEAAIQSCKIWWAEEGKSMEWDIPPDLEP